MSLNHLSQNWGQVHNETKKFVRCSETHPRHCGTIRACDDAEVMPQFSIVAIVSSSSVAEISHGATVMDADKKHPFGYFGLAGAVRRAQTPRCVARLPLTCLRRCKGGRQHRFHIGRNDALVPVLIQGLHPDHDVVDGDVRQRVAGQIAHPNFLFPNG